MVCLSEVTLQSAGGAPLKRPCEKMVPRRIRAGVCPHIPLAAHAAEFRVDGIWRSYPMFPVVVGYPFHSFGCAQIHWQNPALLGTSELWFCHVAGGAGLVDLLRSFLAPRSPQ